MLIRRAVPGDELALIEFSKECYSEMDFDATGYKFEYEAGLRNYANGIGDRSKFILTAWEHSVLVGVTVWCLSNTSQYYDNHLIASEIVFHALPSLCATGRLRIMKKLQKTSEVFCRSIGVKAMFFQYDVRYPAVGRMMEKEGYAPLAIQMYKKLEV